MLENKLLNFGISGIVALASLGSWLAPKAEAYDFAQDAFVDPQSATALVVGSNLLEDTSGPENPEDPSYIGRDHYYWKWLTFPRKPSVSDDWIVYVQGQPLDSDPSDARFSGDIWAIYRPTNEKVKITNSRGANSPDIWENNLVYCDRLNVATDSNDFNQIYLADLSSINLATVDSNTFEPDFVDKFCIYETDAHCLFPEISGDQIVWRKNWTEILRYSIMREMVFPISNSSENKWEPSISGDWVTYSKLSDSSDPVGSRCWNAWGYNLVTGTEFPINEDASCCNREVRVHYDEDSGQAIVAFENFTYGGNNGIGIKRLKREGSEIIINPEDNPYNLPELFPTNGNRMDWIDIHGREGHGPVVVFGEYSGSYGGTDINAINLRTGVEFDVASHPSWEYSPKVWLRSNGSADIVWRNDSFSDPVQTTQAETSQPYIEQSVQTEDPDSYPALVISSLTDRPIPIDCGDPGTYYLEADVNMDCHVDLSDLEILAANWLTSYCGLDNLGENGCGCYGGDLNVDGRIDSEDYKLVIADLGNSTDPQYPDFQVITLPEIDPNLSVTSDIHDIYEYEYEDYYSQPFNPSDTIPHPANPKQIYTYIIEDTTFGLSGINEIRIPTKGIEEMVGYDEFFPYFPDHENSVGSNWIKTEGEEIVFTSPSEEYNLVGGKKLIVQIVSSAASYEGRTVRLNNLDDSFNYLLPVPSEQTLGKYDVNRDQVINLEDLSRISGYWLATGNLNPESGDFNNDGVVDTKDAILIADKWLNKEPIYVD